MSDEGTPQHRGRVQAQGDGIEQSVSWSISSPTAVDGHRMFRELYAMLTPAEQRAREDAFILAHQFIARSASKGGVDAPVSKSFPKGRTVRVDIEVIKGKAFTG